MTTFTAEARRVQILQCAIAAVAEDGFAATTLANVAKRAGVSKGVVSYYFDGKDDLLVRVVTDVYTRAGSEIEARVAGIADPLEALQAYIEANLGFLANRPSDIRAVIEIAANLRGPDGEFRLRPAGPDPLLTHLADMLRAGQDSGVMTVFDPDSVAVMIRAVVDAAAARLTVEPTFDVTGYTAEAAAMITRSVVRTDQSCLR